MLRKSFALAALLAVVLVGSACSKKSSTAAQPSGGGLVTSPPAASAITGAPSSAATPIETSSGGVSIGTGSLPDGFPAEFPIPDGSSPAYSASQGAQGYAVWFSSDQSLDELVSFFDGALPSNGWTVASKVNASDQANGSYTAYSITGNGYAGGIYVGSGAPGAAAFSGNFAFFVVLSPAGA
jgi:hypothetical protein